MSQALTEEERRAQQEIDALKAADYVVPGPAEVEYRAPGECDVVLKGGITSGVVYPLTICKLATRYRLHSIGGTSAGAIAAVLAAAAEYRRRHDPVAPASGFRALAELPGDISTRLRTLFQPQPETRGVFEVLLGALSGGTATGVLRLVRHRLGWFLGGLAVVLAVTAAGVLVVAGWPTDAEGWWRMAAALVLPLLLGLVVGVVAAGVGFVLGAVRLLPRHDFGLTDGATHSGDPVDTPALTPWLADRIDEVAGMGGRCLTLGDLWGEEALDAWREHVADGAGAGPPSGAVTRLRDIDLQTMTTDLTLRRPFRLPFRQQTFLFDEAEMRGLFPARVVETMKAGLPPSSQRNPRTGAPLHYFPGPGTPSDGEPRPGPDALPLVVMARMSLSFPGLISAVPLYAVDHNGDGSVVRHLFSDGGISSNFPMHFFDSLLPRRPTFGINLATPHPRHPDQLTWIPDVARGGVTARAVPVDTVGHFAQALRDAVQNWSDNTQITQRGYAERVVEVRLGPGEGGLNLEMPGPLIMKLVALGAEAGDRLLDFEWDAHRLIRYRTMMIRLSESLEHARAAWSDLGYQRLVDEYPTANAPAVSYAEGRTWRVRDLAATNDLLATVGHWQDDDWPALRSGRPAPAPNLRLAPE